MNEARDKRPPPGPPPSIGYLRDQGVRWFRVFCHAPNCQHGVDLKLDALGLPDETPFPSIATRRQWVCAKCGSRKVGVMPRWPVR